MNKPKDQVKNITTGSRLVGAVIGCVFAGIGLSFLGFLWSQPFGDFHSPPLFFRVIGSFIAIGFVTIGSITAYSAISGRGLQKTKLNNSTSVNSTLGSYTCPKCNAPLSDKIDVSPHGDVKCVYCNGWFNIHHE